MKSYEHSENTPEPVVNGWREVINLPVVSDERPWNLDELEDILRESVETIVKQALKDNDGKIYTTLSGGLDSSLCLAIIRKLYSKVPIYTFTVGSSITHPDIVFAKAASFIFQTFHYHFMFNGKTVLG